MDNSVMLQVSPAQLSFPPPLSRYITCMLLLRNVSAEVLCFKVKTNAPKTYAVRPNSGFLDPGETLDLQVILQPQVEPNRTNRDRFKVQAITVPNRDDHWLQDAFNSRPSEVMDATLKAVFMEAPATNETIALRPRSESAMSQSFLSQSFMDVSQMHAQPPANEPVSQPTTAQPVSLSAPVVVQPIVAQPTPVRQPTPAQPVQPPVNPAVREVHEQVKSLTDKLDQEQQRVAEQSQVDDGIRNRAPKTPVKQSTDATFPPPPPLPSTRVMFTLAQTLLLCLLALLLGRISNRWI